MNEQKWIHDGPKFLLCQTCEKRASFALLPEMFAAFLQQQFQKPSLPSSSCPALSWRPEANREGSWEFYHPDYFTVSSKSHPLLLPSHLELNVLIVFLQTPHWEKTRPPPEPLDLADEKREIKSIFKAILWRACRVGAASVMFPHDVQLCSRKQK